MHSGLQYIIPLVRVIRSLRDEINVLRRDLKEKELINQTLQRNLRIMEQSRCNHHHGWPY